MTSPMESHCISFREIPQTTKLFSSYLEDFGRVAPYYVHPPTEAGLRDAVREVQIDAGLRQRVAQILREQNRAFGADESTERSLSRLESGAVAIVTGQQVGLFSGPSFSFYKAMSAVRCAEDLTHQGVDAVPIFWLATEDHDLGEVNRSFWNSRSGLVRYELPMAEADQGRRVGEVALGEGISSLVGVAIQKLEGGYAEHVDRALRESYRPEETYGSAFGKLMARLLAGRGIIFIDPLDVRFHRLALPVYLRAAEQADSLRDALLARSNELDRTGFHAQVKVARETTLLFCNVDGRRQPVRSHAGDFIVGKHSLSRSALLARIEKSPEDFTPNALLRPLVQDTLLPTAAYVGGPAEIAYMAQTQVAYERLLHRMPVILPRASFTIVEPPVAALLGKYGLDIRDFFRGRQSFRAEMERTFLPEGLARQFEKDERSLRDILSGYEEPLGALDSTLAQGLRLAQRKMLHQFGKLKRKAGRAEGFRTGVLDRHEHILEDSVYPHHGLQERTLCALPFLASYGPQFLDRLHELSATTGSGAGPSCAHQHHVLFL
jgi:bacillithiol biosynthesis cysteine-adding enzyme BshC